MWFFHFSIFLMFVHLGESHMLCRKSFRIITQIMTSMSPFAKWKITGILTKFIGIFQTRSNYWHMYTGFYSIVCLQIVDSKHNVARWTLNSRQRWRLFHSYSGTRHWSAAHIKSSFLHQRISKNTQFSLEYILVRLKLYLQVLALYWTLR